MAATRHAVGSTKMTQLFGVICLVEEVEILQTIRFAAYTKVLHDLACASEPRYLLLETHVRRTYNDEWLESRLFSIKESEEVAKVLRHQMPRFWSGDNGAWETMIGRLEVVRCCTLVPQH
jgi:hypothetical protein